jgi:Na+/melibiose symporter-like transporter
MIDITAERERPVFNAILSVVSLLGQIVILVYTSIASLKKNDIPDGVFYVCASFLFVSYALVFFGVREPRDAATQAEKEEKIPVRVYLRELGVFKEARKCLISIFFLWTGLNAILSYLSLYTTHVFHVSDAKALQISIVLILSSAIAAYPFGRLGARYGMRKMIVLGTLGMIVAAVGGIIAPTYNWLYPIGVLAGFGFSATTALTYPYLAQLVPGSKIGVFTGLQAAFSSVAVPLSVAAASGLIHFFGYRGIFVLLTGMMVFDVLFLLRIDEEAAIEQVQYVELTDETVPGTVPLPAT